MGAFDKALEFHEQGLQLKVALGLNWDWNKLNVNLRSTRYGKYTVIEVECLGACGFPTTIDGYTAFRRIVIAVRRKTGKGSGGE